MTVQEVELVQTTTCDSSGVFSVEMGGPVTGRRWDVRRFCVVDAADPNTSKTGTILLLSTRRPEDPLSTEVDLAYQSGIPTGLPLTERSEILLQNQRLVIAGKIDANRALIVTAMALDYPEAVLP